MKVLITGGTGFLGRNLAFHLLKKGYKVGVVVRDMRKASKIFKKVLLIKGELTNLMEFPKCDVVFHLAAITKEPRTQAERKISLDTNVKGTKSVLEAAVNAGAKRIIFSSTDLVYKQGFHPFSERTPVDPYNFYAKTKLEGESILRNDDRISVTILRFANMYGPFQVWGMIPSFIQSFLKNENVIVYKNKSKDYLYVSDAVELLEKVLNKDIPGIFNVGTGISTSATDVAEMLRKNLEISSSEILIDVAEKSQFTLHDPSKVRKTFKWKNEVSIEEGLAKTVEWWLENK